MPVLLLLSALPLLAPADDAGRALIRCAARSRLVVNHDPRAAIHPLGDEPPATQIAAVDRLIDHCPTPVVLRRSIGSPGKLTSPAIDGDPGPRASR